jgi:acetyl-CoA C-acetyltransferase
VRPVAIAGIGQTAVAEHWDEDLRHLGYYALRAALDDAGVGRVDGVFVGNMLAGTLGHQEHVAALVADFAGLRGIEAIKVEAAGAAGGAALRLGFLAVASGAMDVALVLGVEKFSEQAGSPVTAALSTALDSDFEAAQGLTPAAAAALLMRRYMHETGTRLADFAGFSVNAHANAASNPRAMYRNRISPEAYARAPMVADPVNLFDQAPLGDGAAAAVLVPAELAVERSARVVTIAASAAATDALALHDRHDLLHFESVYAAAVRAYEMAGLGPGDIDVLELHDAYGVYSALVLEAAGFAPRGEGVRLAQPEQIGLMGRLPLSTFGGLKARGDAGGASGMYQVVELVEQLRGTAGDNQVPNARLGMSVAVGGTGASALVHILKAEER